MLRHVLLHCSIAKTAVTGDAQTLRVELRLVSEFICSVVLIHLFQLIFVLSVLLGVPIHHFCPGHRPISVGPLVKIPTPRIDLWREEWFNLFFNTTYIVFFLIIVQVLLSSKA
jgi:hypothetical protein